MPSATPAHSHLPSFIGPIPEGGFSKPPATPAPDHHLSSTQTIRTAPKEDGQSCPSHLPSFIGPVKEGRFQKRPTTPATTPAPLFIALFTLLCLTTSLPLPLHAESVLRNLGYQETTDDLRRCLNQLVPSSDQKNQINDLIRGLQANDYATRESTTTQLLRIPFIPETTLDRAIERAGADQRFRLKFIKAEQAKHNPKDIFQGVLSATAEKKLRGLAPEILRTAEAYSSTDLYPLISRALKATAQPADLPLFAEALRSTPMHQFIALEAYLTLPNASPALAIPFLSSEDPQLQIKAAIGLANIGERKSLTALLALLDSESEHHRSRAANALRQLTGQTFAFSPSDPAALRRSPLKKWTRWIAKNHATCELAFPLEENIQRALIDGQLSQWVESNFQKPLKGFKDWDVENGVLRCKGTTRGHIETKAKYKNYHLSLEWRFPNNTGDSGVGVLTSTENGQQQCLEIQLYPGNCGDFYKIGRVPVENTNGRLSTRTNKLADNVEHPPNQWNRMEVQVKNGAVEVRINGKLMNKTTKGPQEPRSINLRNENSAVEFRNLFLTPLE